jgi:hypothetical protein
MQIKSKLSKMEKFGIAMLILFGILCLMAKSYAIIIAKTCTIGTCPYDLPFLIGDHNANANSWYFHYISLYGFFGIVISFGLREIYSRQK